ncbi:MAG: MFS transporter [Verrucomicrobia bacterium]|nr:MAG: MFS transporter [Verrucomicrobiota bacterium]
MNVSSRVISIPRRRNPLSRGSASNCAGRAEAISSCRSIDIVLLVTASLRTSKFDFSVTAKLRGAVKRLTVAIALLTDTIHPLWSFEYRKCFSLSAFQFFRFFPSVATAIREPCVEASIRSVAPGASPCARTAQRWVLAATILGSSMAFIDSTVVNVALPALQTELGAAVADVQWVIEAYSLLLSALLLVGGSLGDRYGRRRVFAIGIVIFAVASAWCGFAPGIRQLIVARAVQGFGAALLIPGSLAIISSSFREEDRGRAIGTWSGFSAITAAIGPVIGGWAIEHFSWRAVFFINVPIAIIVVVISYWRVPESSGNDKERLDWSGATLIALGLGALVYGLVESSRLSFGHPAVAISLITGFVLLILFIFLETRVRNPMVPLDLFRSRTFTGANLLTLLLYAALGGTLFFLPLNLIQVQYYSPTAAGAALLPLILIIFVLSRWSGGLVGKYGARLPLIIGPIIAAVGFASFIPPGIGGSYWKTFFPAAVILGIGMAISVAPLTTAVMNSVAQTRVGIASGINNAVSRVGGLLAIAVLGIVMLQTFNHVLDRQLLNLPSPVRQALDHQRNKLAGADLPKDVSLEFRTNLREAIDRSFVAGFRAVMFVGALLAAGSAVVAIWLIDSKRPANKTN